MSKPTAQRRRPIVRRARLSGLSIRAYAREHGINENTLAWWSWRLGHELDVSTFVEVAVATRCPPLRVHVGPACLCVDEDTDLALLRQVVEALA